LHLDPQNADAWNNLGTTLFIQNQLDASIDAYNQALRLRPEFPDARSTSACDDDPWRLEQAVVLFREAIALKPDYAAAYANLECRDLKAIRRVRVQCQAVPVQYASLPTHGNRRFAQVAWASDSGMILHNCRKTETHPNLSAAEDLPRTLISMVRLQCRPVHGGAGPSVALPFQAIPRFAYAAA